MKSLLHKRFLKFLAASDRGAQSVDVALWIGLIVAAALTILWPQVQALLESLTAKFQLQ